ncbi:metallophosphoesterase [Sulfolobus sp. A20-N-F6]|uniref:metallophosphoesterase family protein n=2 Tax=Sulfolobaceae TaxID=118883 RepID=UPI000845EFAE|nr:metallophosphoesterase [Sulfolobus sp. A20]TRM78226.1 metallophosphoesterase [Sulfolobus sp. B5]TRM78376.1 metallophosphoesterase [Sulfolobus sp. A20-N-F8]TRM82043.1 metallophosphoesterase [Sulfolobus sp. A20-N-F6]TRM85381.1 metallophosphoesterase [Sulfolobus sp. F3]TRM89084.1 metallophosphoesterase [Sulfolobus sp. C3]TRN02650.1 metallophosphoesterase [Sulfolobus sp. E1]TRN04174.1 metallophosphoesterase [Sulfolobus sp. F1]
MLIISTSDIHSPKYLNEFFLALREISNINADLAILAGDLVEKGYFQHFSPVYSALKNRARYVIATFGNEDYSENRMYYKEKYNDIIWLDDERIDLEVGNIKVTIVGSEGVLESPTKWQMMNGIDENFYMKRLEKLENLLCNSSSDIKILLTHYASTFQTVLGERKSVYPHLGYRIIEKLALNGRVDCLPNIAIHGHAHYAKRTFYVVYGVKVYNVALPANKRILVINT